jgi:hypothetical protein
MTGKTLSFVDLFGRRRLGCGQRGQQQGRGAQGDHPIPFRHLYLLNVWLVNCHPTLWQRAE